MIRRHFIVEGEDLLKAYEKDEAERKALKKLCLAWAQKHSGQKAVFTVESFFSHDDVVGLRTPETGPPPGWKVSKETDGMMVPDRKSKMGRTIAGEMAGLMRSKTPIRAFENAVKKITGGLWGPCLSGGGMSVAVHFRSAKDKLLRVSVPATKDSKWPKAMPGLREITEYEWQQAVNAHNAKVEPKPRKNVR